MPLETDGLQLIHPGFDFAGDIVVTVTFRSCQIPAIRPVGVYSQHVIGVAHLPEQSVAGAISVGRKQTVIHYRDVEAGGVGGADVLMVNVDLVDVSLRLWFVADVIADDSGKGVQFERESWVAANVTDAAGHG